MNLRGGQGGLSPDSWVLFLNVWVLYERGQKAVTTLNLIDFHWLFFYYQGAKGDRGMTGEVGEKGEQVKTECAFQQCCHCDWSFISNSCDTLLRSKGRRWELFITDKPQMGSVKEWNHSNPPQIPSSSPIKTSQYHLFLHLWTECIKFSTLLNPYSFPWIIPRWFLGVQVSLCLKSQCVYLS